MKKIAIITGVITAIMLLGSCRSNNKSTGHAYMPDMAYSRAYETFADHSYLAEQGINYNNRPVLGTMARGEELPFHLAQDAPGDTTNYTASKLVKNPIETLNEAEYKETERLYLINCGICHGAKLNGNGPLYKDGNGPYVAKPATLVGDAKYEAMPDGQMFYSVAYGKNMMGSYASQLSRKQRWMVIKYIKMNQAKGKASAAPAVVADTTAKK